MNVKKSFSIILLKEYQNPTMLSEGMLQSMCVAILLCCQGTVHKGLHKVRVIKLLFCYMIACILLSESFFILS